MHLHLILRILNLVQPAHYIKNETRLWMTVMLTVRAKPISPLPEDKAAHV
jgi:hypothetical protein